MPISLTNVERSIPVTGGGGAALAALQQRVARLSLAQIVQGQRLIVLLEGLPGSGKKGVLRLLAGTLDPCGTAVHCGERLDADGRHWLAPFWSRLPRSGETALFYCGWYQRLVDERAFGRVDDNRWARAADEINEFEAQQADDGTVLVKLFFNAAAHVRAQRLRERLDDPLLGALERGRHGAHPGGDDAVATWEAMFAQTDTRWAPWTVIDGNDSEAAQIAALSGIADVLHKSVPAEAPATLAFDEQRYA